MVDQWNRCHGPVSLTIHTKRDRSATTAHRRAKGSDVRVKTDTCDFSFQLPRPDVGGRAQSGSSVAEDRSRRPPDVGITADPGPKAEKKRNAV